MGWASAGGIFNPVARALLDAGARPEATRRVLRQLIQQLQEGDWDTEDESLALFAAYPPVVAAFADCGITLGADEDDG